MATIRQRRRVDWRGNAHEPEKHPQQGAIDAAQAVLDSYDVLPEGSARHDARAKLALLVRGIALSMLVTGEAPPLPGDGALRRLLKVAMRAIGREVGTASLSRRCDAYRWAER